MNKINKKITRKGTFNKTLFPKHFSVVNKKDLKLDLGIIVFQNHCEMKTSVLFAIAFLVGSVEKSFSQSTPSGVYVNGACFCVTKNYCSLGTDGGPSDGAGIIDPRIMTVGRSNCFNFF